jgi:DNA gyrase inhibitor GyrI
MASSSVATGTISIISVGAVGQPIARDVAPLELPARRYAVFGHESHVSELRTTMERIFGDWLPASGFADEGPPSFFDERPFACPHLNWGMHRGRRCRVPSFPRIGGLFLS